MIGAQIRFVEDIKLTDRIEDWSEVRSPARARRRRRRGFPQRIKVYLVPKADVFQIKTPLSLTYVGHPDTIRKLKEQIRGSSLAPALHR